MRSGPGIGPIRWRRRLLWTIWVNAAQDALPADPKPEPAAHSRREFLKRAAGVAVGLPVAGALAGNAAAAPRISLTSRAKPFDGVTLQFAKAPFGTDEKDVIAKLLKPFEDKTGAKVVHTIVPWNVEGATYATNYAGPNPFDVSYQTSTDLTGLGTKGVLEVLNTKQVAQLARRTRRRRRSSSRTRSRRACTRASSTACRASSAARSSTTTRTCSRRPASRTSRGPSPSSLAAAAKVQALGGGVWGHNVSLVEQGLRLVLPLPRHPQPRHRHHLEGPVEGHLQQRAGGRGAAVLRRPGHEVQGAAAGRAVRPRGRRVAVQGRPDRLPPRRAAAHRVVPQREAPVQVGLHQPGRRRAASARSSRPPATGSWPRRARTRTPRGSS